MCQVVDDYLPAKAKTPPWLEHTGNHNMFIIFSTYCSVGKKCMKCEKSAVTTARTKDPFCKSVPSVCK